MMPEIEGLQWIVPLGQSYAANLGAAVARYKQRYGCEPVICYAGAEAYQALTANRNVLGELRDLLVERLGTIHRWTLWLCGGRPAAGCTLKTEGTAAVRQYPPDSEWTGAVIG